MKATLTLGDGFVSVCPFPETLLAKLHYWKRQLVVNERTHRREFKGSNELLYTLQTGVGPDGTAVQTCFTLPGFAKRVKDHLTQGGYEVAVVDARTPMPPPDMAKAMTGLREYQYELVYNLLMSGGGILSAATGCLAEGTPVRLYDGRIKPVEDIVPGDVLLAFDDKTSRLTSSTVYDMIRTDPNHKPKPMLEVSINGREHICTTYDHPFFAGDGFYPLYQLVWGALEASQRAHLELLCKQYGAPFDHTTVWKKESSSNGPCLRPEWVLQDRDEWSYCEGTSSCCGGVAGEPAWTISRKPYRLQSYEQPGREPGVVHSKIQCVVWGNPWKHSCVPTPAAGHPDAGGEGPYPRTVSTENEKQAEAPEVWKCKGRNLAADPTGVSSGQESASSVSSTDCIRPEITVKAAAPYYTIRTREAPYTYCIGREHCYLTHNCGKTHIIKALCNAYSHEVLMARGTPTIVVAVPDKDITQKNFDDLTKLLPDRDVGLIMSGRNKPSDDIQVITLDSLHKLDADDVGVLIVDEMHTAASDTRAQELLRFTKARCWGVSATPDGRFDGKDTVAEGIFGPIVARFTYQDGVKAGCLVPIKVFWIDCPEPNIGLENYERYQTRDKRYLWGVYNNRPLNELIGRIYAGLPPDLQALGMLQFTKHMEQVLRGCAKAGVNPMPTQVHAGTDAKEFPASSFWHVHAISPKERRELYDVVKSGQTSKIISTFVYKQGVDFPNLRVVINIGGGGSEIVSKQVPGRASRKADGKDGAYIIEFRHHWDTVKSPKTGRDIAGPVFRDDVARMRIYTELGFEQVDLLNERELPWMTNSNSPTR